MHSTQWRHPESLSNQSHAIVSKRFTPKSSPAEHSALSESLEHVRGGTPLTESKSPMTVSGPDDTEWSSRMDRMEKRQERIESLLIQLTKNVRLSNE